MRYIPGNLPRAPGTIPTLTEIPDTVRVAVSGVTYWVDRPYTYTVPESLHGHVRPGMRVAVPFGGHRPREGIVLAMGGDTQRKLKPVMELLDDEPLLTEDQLKLALWMRERFFCTVMDAVRAMLPSGLWYRVKALYCFARDVQPETAFGLAGNTAERLVIETLAEHGGKSDFSDIEAVFGTKNPGPALASLVRKGVLTAGAESSRKASDKTILRVSLRISPQEAAEIADKSSRAPRQGAVLRVLSELGSASVADICYFTGSNRETVRALEKKGYVTISRQTVLRRPDYESGSLQPMPVLNRDQQRAFEGILSLLDDGRPSASLLFGVTGSGKTTIYIHLISEVLKRGRSAILMVPEIALTPQMLRTFSAHFGDSIAVVHSALSIGERYDEWKRIRSGAARVVIGTRSAVFAPVSDPGIIIIDEEQEDTYKSDSAPRYHARDVAKYICSNSRSLLLLGSATPDVRSRYYAEQGRYSFFTLPGRYNAMDLPSVTIADMRAELARGNGLSISSVLRDEIEQNLRKNEQSILFLNRRGANKLVACGSCGYTYQCPNCSANLTYHSVGDRLICHYCGHVQRPAAQCPLCGGVLRYVGTGTQKVSEELGQLFPGVPVLRMDADSVAPVGSHRALFEQFRTKRIPILVGTQMVTKGLNFENVTLVGVLSADQSLYSGDYRAGERTFSLITQVIGRSGRFEKSGRAVIQTFTPDNQTIRQAAAQDYESFYQAELTMRRLTGSPPFSEMYVLTAAGPSEAAVIRCCEAVKREMLRLLGSVPDTRVLGPAPLFVAKMNNIWRYRITVSSPDGKLLRSAVSSVLTVCNGNSAFRGVSLYADYDPSDA